ncbi:MAG: phosphoesterase [Bradyrhizobium sp.]|nr:MAG: phosphoesterase [Bradyrhizobium sp.]
MRRTMTIAFLRHSVSVLALACAALSTLALVARAQERPIVTAQPDPGPVVAPFVIDPSDDPPLPDAAMAALVRDKIKYVFVIFNENHSFDNEFGTFPGVDGLYSDGLAPRAPDKTPGFTQTYTDLSGATVTVSPFLIGAKENASFVDSVDHSHKGLAAKLDVVDGVPRMDRFAADEYAKYAKPGNNMAQAQGAQFARLVMSHIDCDTIPFYWNWANRFAIFDRIFATEDTPSTPNAIAMIAGQSGETQWVKHADDAKPPLPMSGTINGKTYDGTGAPQRAPIVNDPNPFWGSQYDATVGDRRPTSPAENYAPGNVAENLTFATVPLTAMAREITATTSRDLAPETDLADVKGDVPYIQNLNGASVAWRWYQNGYDLEPSDSDGVASHANYVAHHNGAQYFGYIANNPLEAANLKGEGDFFADVAAGRLPKEGGIFYVRGGFRNIRGVTPPIQNANYPDAAGLTADELQTINKGKSGDDDHPGYSDRQISEAMNAEVVNAIASNPDLWRQSAIVLTYDESDGFYDHAPPRILSYGPDKLPLARGIRVPLLLISPYARAHVASHAEGDHNAVIETINAIFNLSPLSQLPEEAAALKAGDSPEFNAFAPDGFHQTFLGPRDTNSPITDSLLSGFSPKRLRGEAAALPADYALTPSDALWRLPHYSGQGCKTIGVVPEDVRQGIDARPPANFNTLPATLPAYN